MSGPALVVVYHGIGAFGYDVEPLAVRLARHLPGTRFAVPDAPCPFDYGPGCQWYSHEGIDARNRPERVVAARPAFDEQLSGLLSAHGLTDAPEQVALVGFSQGAIMVLDAVASGRWRVGAVAGLSGRLATPDPLHPTPGVPVRLLHGADDPVVPPEESVSAELRLAAAGCPVTLTLLRGVGHVFTGRGALIVARFLQAAIVPPSGAAA